jgi:hypothetical protein
MITLDDRLDNFRCEKGEPDQPAHVVFGERPGWDRLSSAGQTLSDTESVALRRPFQRQVNAVEQGFGAELGGLLSLADRFPEGGCDEGQALSRAWWSFIA